MPKHDLNFKLQNSHPSLEIIFHKPLFSGPFVMRLQDNDVAWFLSLYPTIPSLFEGILSHTWHLNHINIKWHLWMAPVDKGLSCL